MSQAENSMMQIESSISRHETERHKLDHDIFWENPEKYAGYDINSLAKYVDNENRSSTIFPVYFSKGSTSYISFLNYWSLKHGNNVVMLLTARNSVGEVLCTTWLPIFEVKSYVIDLKKSFPSVFNADGFGGSVEVEVFSRNKPLYTFPAITLFYEGLESLSAVHSCVRTYNHNEVPTDYALGLPQSGFDVMVSKEFNTYFIFFGGEKKRYNFQLILKNHEHEVVRDVVISNSCRGQMHVVLLADIFSNYHSDSFVALSIAHDLDVFPRFYCGLISGCHVPTLTHTFFDTSEKNLSAETRANSPLLGINSDSSMYFDSAFIIPVMPSDQYITELKTYGQNISFVGEIHLDLFDVDGALEQSFHLNEVEASAWNGWICFNVTTFLERHGVSINRTKYLRIGFESNGGEFPLRFKMGLNISKVNSGLIGSNICFAPLVQGVGVFSKPLTRRWFPLGGTKQIVATVHNTSFLKTEVLSENKLKIKIFNYLGQCMDRNYELRKNGSIFFSCQVDRELNEFLQGKIGWCLVEADHFLLDSYYFSTEGTQIGGDHSF